ncbi:GntR family transcriptional regulator [Microvirga massiliensis]|uniref:GntR family transcriptional regulator n=1 Tax=Microvirga massiliensis TaxID=1033741 RepID=UPI00062BC168|nr:GntR family transcriptional regulator [Microvirga massiliensis]
MDDTPGYRPLYRQVRDILVKRIATGVWQAGQILPSEGDIAADLGVSQGTVRKALDEMTAENLVTRRQGRGTFVARHDDARILFQFFKLLPDTGERRFPESRVLSVHLGPESEAARILDLAETESVIRIERVRSLDEQPCIFEHIYLPESLFRGLDQRDLPNNLYQLYSVGYGVTIARATERLKAVAAQKREAKALGGAPGDPFLRIDRTAYALDSRPVEWRISLCRTESVHYLSDLR